MLIVGSGTTLSRNNPVPKEAEKVLKKIQALIVERRGTLILCVRSF